VEHEFHKYCMPTLIEGSVVDSYVQSKYGDRFGRSEEVKSIRVSLIANLKL